jgi:hypothetical protein
MSRSHSSARFSLPAWAEKLIPLVLAFLVLILLAALVVVGLSLMGVTPSA